MLHADATCREHGSRTIVCSWIPCEQHGMSETGWRRATDPCEGSEEVSTANGMQTEGQSASLSLGKVQEQSWGLTVLTPCELDGGKYIPCGRGFNTGPCGDVKADFKIRLFVSFVFRSCTKVLLGSLVEEP